MDELQKFKSDLDTLKNKRAVLEAKISSVQQEAVRLKIRMEGMGYKSIAEAVEDYKRRTAGLADKQAKVETLIKQIETVDTNIPSREEILAKLRREMSSTSPELTEPTEVCEDPLEGEEPQIPSDSSDVVSSLGDFKFSL